MMLVGYGILFMFILQDIEVVSLKINLSSIVLGNERNYRTKSADEADLISKKRFNDFFSIIMEEALTNKHI